MTDGIKITEVGGKGYVTLEYHRKAMSDLASSWQKRFDAMRDRAIRAERRPGRLSENPDKSSSKEVNGFGIVVCSLCNEVITCSQAVAENPSTMRLDHRKCAIKQEMDGARK